MPIKVTTSPVTMYQASISGSLRTNRKTITPGYAFDRLPKNIQALYQLYPCIPYLSGFIKACYLNLDKLTYSGIQTGIRLCAAFKKCLSGIEFELENSADVEQQVFLALLQILLANLKADFIKESVAPHALDASGGGTRLELSHELEETLISIEKWFLLEDLVATNLYTPFSNSLSTTILQLSAGAEFIRR